MLLDHIGRYLHTNRVDITPERVRKRFRDYYVPMLWGRLERKPYENARQRYDREKAQIRVLSRLGLNVPEIISESDTEVTLEWKTLELTDFVTLFLDETISGDQKIEYFKDALAILYKIQKAGHSLVAKYS